MVDGPKIRRELYIDFSIGGNDQRYKFIPKNEIWIDNSISVEELQYTIIHEIFERKLLKKGLTYNRAHDLAAQEEWKYRQKNKSYIQLPDKWE